MTLPHQDPKSTGIKRQAVKCKCIPHPHSKGMLAATTVRDGPHSGMHVANTPAKELTSQTHKETLTARRKNRGVLFMYVFPQCWV